MGWLLQDGDGWFSGRSSGLQFGGRVGVLLWRQFLRGKRAFRLFLRFYYSTRIDTRANSRLAGTKSREVGSQARETLVATNKARSETIRKTNGMPRDLKPSRRITRGLPKMVPVHFARRAIIETPLRSSTSRCDR